MTEPMTVNVGLIVPNTGDLVGTWGSGATNPDYVAIDGLIGGVQIISAGAAPITLTSPASFTPTPGGGPTQSQNRVLRFTGVLTADVVVTLPLPGSYIIENLTTTAGNFILSFRAVVLSETIGAPAGECFEIYNDGANVRFVGLARMGSMEMWANLIDVPRWVAFCTVPPYLLCNGTIYNISAFPALGARLGSTFGGNGSTTFAVPDMRGRVPLAFDGTGTRITTAGCGLNGQTIGASLDQQAVTLSTAQIPSHQHAVFLKDPGHHHPLSFVDGQGGSPFATGSGFSGPTTHNTGDSFTGMTIGSINGVANDNQTATAGGGQPHPNVQPSLVTGIWAIKT